MCEILRKIPMELPRMLIFDLKIKNFNLMQNRKLYENLIKFEEFRKNDIEGKSPQKYL